MRRIKEGSRVWQRRYLELADAHLHARSCRNCGSPALQGIVCNYCNVDDTSWEFEQAQKAKRAKQ
jgi:ribosomal protein L32